MATTLTTTGIYTYANTFQSTASTILDTETTWITWVDDDVNSGTTSYLSTIWNSWTVATADNWIDLSGVAQQQVQTAEQLAAAQLLAERRQREDAARQHAIHAASTRARTLLLALLSVAQREQFERDRYFDVIGHHSKRRYRIHQGTHGNVRLLDDKGREVTRYCGQPVNVPAEDAMLAQKLQLEHDEQGYLRAANATHLRAA